jgi:hypothetical protein
MDGMVVMHAHPSPEVVRHLAHIEVAHTSTAIVPAAGPWTFSYLELKLLYQNTTGENHDGFSRPHLEALVTDAMQRLEPSDVKPFEVQQQASKISAADSGFYRYVKGSFTAAKLQALFEPAARTTTPGTVAPAASAAPPGQAPKTSGQAPQFTQPLPSWHPAYKTA